MKRLLQIATIVLAGWLCVVAVRPFLTQVNLEWGKRRMNQAVKTAQAARKNKQPLTTALRELNEAQKHFSAARRITLGDGQVWLFLAHVVNFTQELDKDISRGRRQSKQKEVITLVNEAESFYVDNNMILRRAMAYLALGNTMKAIQGLETALYFYSTWSQATRPIVAVYRQEIMKRNKKEPERILRAMERLVERFHSSLDAVTYLGKVYLDRKRPDEARLCFREAGQRRNRDIDLGRLTAQSYAQELKFTESLWELCRTLYFSKSKKSKELNPVIGMIRRLLKQNPKNADAHFIMGTVQQDRLADFNAAKRDYYNAFKIRKAHFETVKRLAEVSKRLGEEENAAKWRAVVDKILSYSKKVRLVLPSGKKRDAHCLFVAEANELSPLIGKVVRDEAASSGNAVLLSRSNGRSVPITLRCPPLPAGVYELSVRMKIPDLVKGPKTKLAKIWLDGESVTRPRSIGKARKFVYGRDFKRADEYLDFTVKFYHPGLVDYEIWIEHTAVCDMFVDRIAVGFVGD